MAASVRRLVDRNRAHLVVTGALAGVLALTGSCVALGRLDARSANPEGIPIGEPRREPLPGGPLEFQQLSPGGAFYALVQTSEGEPANEVLLVVDAVRGTVVGRLPGAGAAGGLRNAGWRDSSTVWVSAAELAGGSCVSAYSASAPDWAFGPDDCGRRPPSAGLGFEYRREPSPDGVLVAKTTYDRYRRNFMDSYPLADVRLEDGDGRFLAQLGGLVLVGWAADGSLIVIGDTDHRPYRITRTEIESLVRPG